MIAALMSCQLMDKTTNSYAAVMGLRTDLKMSSQEYSWVGSSFYLGYLVFEYPAGLALQKLPLSKTLSVAVIIWGIVLMCHAACQSAATFLLCQLVFGTSQGLGTLLGAAIAYGLKVHRDGEHSFASWRLFYIITGVITIFLGVVSMLHIPDLPVKAWFLNEEDKRCCVERARHNQQGFGNHRLKLPQLREAALDPITYLIFIYAMTYAIPNGGLNNFGTILLNSDFGFSTTDSILMNMPGGAIDVVIPPLVAIINHKFLKDKRLISMILVNLLCVVGTCLLIFTGPRGSRLAGYYIIYTSTTCMAGIASIVSSNVAGHSKKVVVSTVFLIGYCAGNMIGPQTFVEAQAPDYVGAKTAMLVCYCVGAAAMGAMYVIYYRRNRKWGKPAAETGDLAFADLTDKQNPDFRYEL
ncbi:hypothetical protein KL905_004621 [Ogataea polymorpha]|nr:hypothetical protein KL907_002123 [Ogataea polymorpha]KAG7908634.1 hypothetical protein KL906_002865 [Ogataea polymorpha]KAG7916218.1 hypothetical protein KL905_004621 [Ogataea polymorpha]KAG7920757.1 hypothetical protein KL927_000001 [Ogataea polymorpha]KAG7939610.1 hypothetical protein KL934_000544 [Ogataea polymorpha]